MAKDDNGAVEPIVRVDSHAPGTRKERRATYRDVLNAPPNMVAEILDGRLYTHPRPAPRHAWASSGLGSKLGDPFNFGRGGPGGWLIVDEPELHLGDDIVVPDLAGWRRRRWMLVKALTDDANVRLPLFGAITLEADSEGPCPAMLYSASASAR